MSDSAAVVEASGVWMDKTTGEKWKIGNDGRQRRVCDFEKCMAFVQNGGLCRRHNTLVERRLEESENETEEQSVVNDSLLNDNMASSISTRKREAVFGTNQTRQSNKKSRSRSAQMPTIPASTLLLRQTVSNTVHRISCQHGGTCELALTDGKHAQEFEHPDYCIERGLCHDMHPDHLRSYLHVPLCPFSIGCQQWQTRTPNHCIQYRHRKFDCELGDSCSALFNDYHMSIFNHPFKIPCPFALSNCKQYWKYLGEQSFSSNDDDDNARNHCRCYSHVCVYGDDCPDKSDRSHARTEIHPSGPRDTNVTMVLVYNNMPHYYTICYAGVRDSYEWCNIGTRHWRRFLLTSTSNNEVTDLIMNLPLPKDFRLNASLPRSKKRTDFNGSRTGNVITIFKTFFEYIKAEKRMNKGMTCTALTPSLCIVAETEIETSIFEDLYTYLLTKESHISIKEIFRQSSTTCVPQTANEQEIVWELASAYSCNIQQVESRDSLIRLMGQHSNKTNVRSSIRNWATQELLSYLWDDVFPWQSTGSFVISSSFPIIPRYLPFPVNALTQPTARTVTNLETRATSSIQRPFADPRNLPFLQQTANVSLFSQQLDLSRAGLSSSNTDETNDLDSFLQEFLSPLPIAAGQENQTEHVHFSFPEISDELLLPDLLTSERLPVART